MCRVSACSADKQKCAGHVVIDARGTLTVLKSIDFDFYVRKEVYIVRVLSLRLELSDAKNSMSNYKRGTELLYERLSST